MIFYGPGGTHTSNLMALAAERQNNARDKSLNDAAQVYMLKKKLAAEEQARLAELGFKSDEAAAGRQHDLTMQDRQMAGQKALAAMGFDNAQALQTMRGDQELAQIGAQGQNALSLSDKNHGYKHDEIEQEYSLKDTQQTKQNAFTAEENEKNRKRDLGVAQTKADAQAKQSAAKLQATREIEDMKNETRRLLGQQQADLGNAKLDETKRANDMRGNRYASLGQKDVSNHQMALADHRRRLEDSLNRVRANIDMSDEDKAQAISEIQAQMEALGTVASPQPAAPAPAAAPSAMPLADAFTKPTADSFNAELDQLVTDPDFKAAPPELQQKALAKLQAKYSR